MSVLLQMNWHAFCLCTATITHATCGVHAPASVVPPRARRPHNACRRRSRVCTYMFAPQVLPPAHRLPSRPPGPAPSSKHTGTHVYKQDARKCGHSRWHARWRDQPLPPHLAARGQSVGAGQWFHAGRWRVGGRAATSRRARVCAGASRTLFCNAPVLSGVSDVFLPLSASAQACNPVSQMP